MSTLSRSARFVKPRNPGTCQRCSGLGRRTRRDDSETCPGCDGFGRVRFVEEEPPVYSATQGDDLLDVGGPLEDFVQLQAGTWRELEGDVAVWRKDDRGLKLVAVLSADAAGKTCVRWL